MSWKFVIHDCAQQNAISCSLVPVQFLFVDHMPARTDLEDRSFGRRQIHNLCQPRQRISFIGAGRTAQRYHMPGCTAFKVSPT